IALLTRRFSSSQREKQHNRSTKMILAIMLMFIIVELPQGILALTPDTAELSQALGDLYEMITLLTSCVIFALLCTTSEKVRRALFDSHFVRFLRKAAHNCICIRFRHNNSKLRDVAMLQEDKILERATSELDKSSCLESVHL
ncbi:hypothetical protein PMAYCL1PPCAC_03946, partial [Pristionchus mayeri]